MTDKERVHAALGGRPVDRVAVTSLDSFLYHQDHFAELTGRPAWELHKWLHAPPEKHVETHRILVEAAPFETLQRQGAASREARESIEFVERDGVMCPHDTRTDTCRRLSTASGRALAWRMVSASAV